MLPRMLLRTVPKVVGSAAGKLIRERCKQFRHGNLQDLWHLAPEEVIQQPQQPTDEATVAMGTFLTRQGELSKAVSRMCGSGLKSIEPGSDNEDLLRSKFPQAALPTFDLSAAEAVGFSDVRGR